MTEHDAAPLPFEGAGDDRRRPAFTATTGNAPGPRTATGPGMPCVPVAPTPSIGADCAAAIIS